MLANLNKKNPLADYIKRYVSEKKRSINILVKGPTQYRKSTITYKLCLELEGDKFDLNKQMAIIKTSDMMRLANEKLAKGRVRWFDEIGVGMNHKEWYNMMVKAMNTMMQTHGFRRSINFHTVPYSSFIDKDMRKLFDIEIEILHKNEEKRYVIAKIRLLQYNEDLDKLYKKYIRGLLPDGRVVPIETWKIAYPTEEQLEKYFTIANKAKEELQLNLTKKTSFHELTAERREGFDPNKYAEEILKNLPKFVHKWHGKTVIPEEAIMNEFKVGLLRAKQIKAAVNLKLNQTLSKPDIPDSKDKELSIDL